MMYVFEQEQGQGALMVGRQKHLDLKTYKIKYEIKCLYHNKCCEFYLNLLAFLFWVLKETLKQKSYFFLKTECDCLIIMSILFWLDSFSAFAIFHLLTAVWWEDQGLQRGWVTQSEYQHCSSLRERFVWLFLVLLQWDADREVWQIGNRTYLLIELSLAEYSPKQVDFNVSWDEILLKTNTKIVAVIIFYVVV